jgi:hypothetical protein
MLGLVENQLSGLFHGLGFAMESSEVIALG